MTPWKTGYYKSSGLSGFYQVDGNVSKMSPFVRYDHPDVDPWMNNTWKSGDFGPTCSKMKEASGADNFNLEVSYSSSALCPPSKGVVSSDGSKVYTFMPGSDMIEVLEWISGEDLKEMADARDDAKAPTCSYKLQPQKQGKIVWLTGPPGCGKSTTAQLLGRENDFAYYEGDCVFAFLNPFVPVDAEDPAMAAYSQPPLKNVSKDMVEAVKVMKPNMKAKEEGKFDQIDLDLHEPLFKCMALDVALQKKRIGGNFAVAHVVHSRKARDLIRSVLPDVIFVVLQMPRELNMKRMMARHGESEAIADAAKSMFKMYQDAGQDEPNTIGVDMTESMTPQDVKNKIIQELEKFN